MVYFLEGCLDMAVVTSVYTMQSEINDRDDTHQVIASSPVLIHAPFTATSYSTLLPPRTPQCQPHPHTNTTTPPSAPSYAPRTTTTHPQSPTPSVHAQAAIAAAQEAVNAEQILSERPTGTRTRGAYRHGNSCVSPSPWAGARSLGQCMHFIITCSCLLTSY